MKNSGQFSFLAIVCYLLLAACNTATPERYFDVAVLNTNMIVGATNDGIIRELDQPSVKLVEGTKDQTAPMKRVEIIQQKIVFVENAVDKLDDLKETAETKEMLQTSKELHGYVLNIYQREYMELAKLYDEGASKELVTAKAQAIHDKYNPRFEELYNKLIGIGKTYAAAHQIKVNWAQ